MEEMGHASSRPSMPSSSSLKRAASPSFEGLQEDASRKRIKSEGDLEPSGQEVQDCGPVTPYTKLVEELFDELTCHICSALLYRPVSINPCQHSFCGACCVSWIKNGGTSCPSCRGISSIAMPCRPLQQMIDVLLRADPSKERVLSERTQADAIYKAGTAMRIPSPREQSPPVDTNIENQSAEFARPCPYCSAAAEAELGWRCPTPIPAFNAESGTGWNMETDGMPPGHAYCANCENLLPIRAPSTTKCDLCQTYYCGLNTGRCVATTIANQHPHNMADVADLIQSSDLYENFNSNTVEVDILLDYLAAQGLTPRHIYREIVADLQSKPRGFQALIEEELFVDIHPVGGGNPDPAPDAPRVRSCRVCAGEVFIHELRNWWIRERKKGFLEASVTSRKDCVDGRDCERQTELAHAKEFNHIIADPVQPAPPEPPAPSTSGSAVSLTPEPQTHPAAAAADEMAASNLGVEATSIVDTPVAAPVEADDEIPVASTSVSNSSIDSEKVPFAAQDADSRPEVAQEAKVKETVAPET